MDNRYELWQNADTLVFDLDGCLLHTIDDLAMAANRALAAENYPARTVEEIKSFIGSGIAVLLAKAASLDPEKSEKEMRALRQAFDEAYDKDLWLHTRPYPGIKELLAYLQAEGFCLAVLSNKPERWTKRLIEHFFPGVFRDIRGQRDGVPRKPDPHALWQQLEELGRDKKRTLYLGDSDVDMKTACHAGLPGIGTAWGFRSEEVLRANGAAQIFRSPAELQSFLEEGAGGRGL